MAASEPKKSPGLLCATIATLSIVVYLSWRAYGSVIPATAGSLLWAFFWSFHFWWVLSWLWGIHWFWTQLFSILASSRRPSIRFDMGREPVAVLYATCDDFDPDAALSCLQQTHSGTRLIICDDSREREYRDKIDAWASSHQDDVKVVRRDSRRGFKAGNLNNAIARHVTEEFIVICDADEMLPSDFVARILGRFNDDVGFVQAAHRARRPGRTRFADCLGISVDVLYSYLLPCKNRYGFVSCYGHGVMLRRSTWKRINGLPEIVAEDIGFAARVRAAGYRGVYAGEIVAEEAYPPNYRSFLRTNCKAVRGTVEFLQQEAPHFLATQAVPLVEKLDLLITSSFCLVGVVTLVSAGTGLWVLNLSAQRGYSTLQPGLMALYLVGPLTPLLPFAIEARHRPFAVLNHVPMAALAHVSLMPALCFSAVQQGLKIGRPTFRSTGSEARQRIGLPDVAGAPVTGAALAIASYLLPSPAQPTAYCLSLMLALGPVVGLVNRSDAVGLMARYIGVVPYSALAALMMIRP